MFRPAQMAWADLIVDRDAVSETLGVLGNLDIIELQRPADDARTFPIVVEPDESLIKRLTELDRLLQPFASRLTAPDSAGLSQRRISESTESALPQLEKQLGAWLGAAHPLVEQLRSAANNVAELELLALCLEAIPEHEFEIEHLARSTAAQNYPVFITCGDARNLAAHNTLDEHLIKGTYPVTGGRLKGRVVVIGVCASAQLPKLEKQLHGAHWRFVRMPVDLKGTSIEALNEVGRRINAERRRHADLAEALDELSRRSRIAALRWLLQRHLWVTLVLADARRGQRFVWLSGWVPAARLRELSASLGSQRVPFLLNAGSAAGHGAAPVQLENPGWIRRFETFVRGFGVPNTTEIDPSPVLAVTTPLMFGYMFGDVGQGMVLIVIGWWLRARLPVLGLLIPAGISSMVFGVLFGSFFCNEHIFPALWLSPLQAPLTILALPVGFGVSMILLSLVFDATQKSWQGHAGEWWILRFPIILIYLGLMTGALDQRGFVVAGIGLIWVVIAQALNARRKMGIMTLLAIPLKACIELLETLLQMFINTLSFTRLGAFALAHAGLGMAVVILADMPDTELFKWMVLITGNLVVIALEGLVVSIQTTRLVMFEFFRRFLLGHGRPFRPLRVPGPVKEQFAAGVSRS